MMDNSHPDDDFTPDASFSAASNTEPEPLPVSHYDDSMPDASFSEASHAEPEPLPVSHADDSMPDASFSEANHTEPEPLPLPADDQPIHVYDPAAALREFEELSLSAVVGQFFYAPRSTLRAFTQAIQPQPRYSDDVQRVLDEIVPPPVVQPEIVMADSTDEILTEDSTRGSRLTQLILYVLAILTAVSGAAIMVANHPVRAEDPQLIEGARRFIWAGMFWIGADLIGRREQLWVWFTTRTRADWQLIALWGLVSIVTLIGLSYWLDASDESLILPEEVTAVVAVIGQGAQVLLLAGILFGLALAATIWRWRNTASTSIVLTPAADELSWYMQIHPVRPFFIMLAVFLTTVTWFNSVDNNLTDLGFAAWLGSVAFWVLAFAPRSWWNPVAGLRGRWQRVMSFNALRDGWVVVAMLLVILVAANYRLTNLNGIPADKTAVPQEMTSDHVEKILDSARVREGSRNIFFANNGGREPVQMYLMAAFSTLPGQSMGYASLKLLAVLESLFTIPFFFWLGWDLFRSEPRRFRQIMGIVLAGLVAVSYWDETVTRLALRIILTPLVATVLLVYLARAMRSNQVGDFLKAGLILGFGLYTYQAVRMLPVVVVLAGGLALFTWWRRRGGLRLFGNMLVLILVAVMAFVPMIHYTAQYPEQFLRRTFGRLLGDGVIEEQLPNGILVTRDATVQDQVNAFVSNLPVLFSNLRNAVLMFNWKGDVAWINNVPNYPALDIWSGGLFAVGVIAWLSLAYRRRDPVYVMIPLALLVMLLPSALSIAYPIENPSFTRTSGALPMVYLIAALPLALLVEAILRWNRKRIGQLLAVGAVALPLVGSYSLNYSFYLKDFADSYIISSLPYSDGGRLLQQFVTDGGSFGNAYLIGYPNWWDHRALGLTAGLETRWPNGVYDTNPNDAYPLWVDYLPEFMQAALDTEGIFHLDPNRDLLLFYSPNDLDTSARLKSWFPNGNELLYPSYQPGDTFYIYRVPALGDAGVQQFLTDKALPGG